MLKRAHGKRQLEVIDIGMIDIRRAGVYALKLSSEKSIMLEEYMQGDKFDALRS